MTEKRREELSLLRIPVLDPRVRCWSPAASYKFATKPGLDHRSATHFGARIGV
jgi:hypothetical protein